MSASHGQKSLNQYSETVGFNEIVRKHFSSKQTKLQTAEDTVMAQEK